MADKAISELVAAPSVTPDSLFVLQQDNTAKKLTAQVLENWLLSFAGGHGGIQSWVPLKTEGLVTTYRITLTDQTHIDIDVVDGRGIESIKPTSTNGLVVTYTITYNDGTTSTFNVTNGAKGDKGDRADIWVKYASQKPTASSHSFGDVPDSWIGIATGHNMDTAPTDWQQYQWYQWKGEKGDPGEPATLVSSQITYQVGDSGTIIPSGSWSESIPPVSQGKYLWTREITQFNTGNPITKYSVSRFGIDGTGAVSTVAGVSPDADGNVPLTAADVKAMPIGGGTMEGPINMNGQSLSGLNAPTKDDEAANKGYVDQHTNPPLPGVIYPYSGANIPDGFLLCDGAAYSRTEYAELFAAIGTMYGSGDGSTTFNVPDLVERVPAGAGDNHPAGKMVGEETHILTMDEMPSHSHGSETAPQTGTIGFADSSGTTSSFTVNYGPISSRTDLDIRVALNGGSHPHNIMQPTTFIRGYIIATGKGSGVSVQDIIAGVQALPLGIEYGGIGATNAVDARKNLGIREVRRNLLDNSYFANPVNQRGVTDCTAQGYTIDRWIFRTGTADGEKLTVQDGGVRVTKTSTSDNYTAFKQSVNLSENKLAGKTVTFAARVLEATTSFRLRITGGPSAISDANAYTNKTFNNTGILFVTTTLPNPLPYDYLGVVINLESPGSVLIEWAALYEGEYTADNLPVYQPKGYGVELAECRRYYQSGTARFTRSTSLVSFICVTSLIPAMRIIPTVSYTNLTTYLSGSSVTISGSIHTSRRDLLPGLTATENQDNDYALQCTFQASADL